MIFTTLKGVASRRPLSTITAATTASSLSYAFYIEHGNSKRTSYIPRHHYDAIAIEKYWTERPLSAARRIIDIACELGPVAVEYLYKFHLRPRLFVGSECDDLRCEAIGSDEDETRQLSQKLRDALTNLGPTFIKVGQQLSIRPDLVSPIVLYELQRLCDAVPPFDCQVAMKVLAQELPSTNAECDNNSLSTQDVNNKILRFFQEMPQLVASASLGQVYKAKLRNTNSQHEQDQEVAIKIQRPDIFETVTLDLFLLITYGKTVDKLCSLFTNQIPYHENFLNGFSSGAFMELNYVNEAENQLFFRKELHERFNGQTDCTNAEKKQSILSFLRAHSIFPSEKVVIPNVYSQYTTERILVTEWIDGKPLAQCPTEQIRELIPVGVELFLCQLLDIGKFHADPHPGNLYVTTSKEGKPTLALLDFGLIANVDKQARNAMTQAIVNLLQGDYDTLISQDAKNLGFLPHDMDVTDLKPVLKTILKTGLVDSGSNLRDRKRNLMAISNELNEVFFQHPFSVPPFFALITRGLGLLEGIALSGDPSFDIFKASYPYAKKRAVETLSVSDYGKISRNLVSLRFEPAK